MSKRARSETASNRTSEWIAAIAVAFVVVWTLYILQDYDQAAPMSSWEVFLVHKAKFWGGTALICGIAFLLTRVLDRSASK